MTDPNTLEDQARRVQVAEHLGEQTVPNWGIVSSEDVLQETLRQAEIPDLDAISTLFNSEAFDAIIEHTEKAIDQDPELGALDSLEDQINREIIAAGQASRTGDSTLANMHDAEIKLLQERAKEISPEKHDEHSRLIEQARLARRRQRDVLPDSPQATKLFAVMDSAPSFDDHETVLQDRIFIPNVPQQAIGSEQGEVIVKARAGTSLTVPTGLLVSAEGFDSWQGRGIQGKGEKMPNRPPTASDKSRYSSREIIEEYAAMETPLPPVEGVNIYLQPDGKIYGHVAAGAHRAAAALLRGEEQLETAEIRFIKLNSNVLL